MFLGPNLDDIRGFLGALYGREVSRDEIADLGWECLEDEWEFNRQAGFTEADDRLADCLSEDPIGAEPTVFDVPDDVIQAAKKRIPADESLFTMRSAG